MTRWFTALCLLCVALVVSLPAQTPAPASASSPAAPVTVIKAGRLIDHVRG